MSAPPANAGALVGTRLGDYELVALLALGGTAEIYLARVGGHAGFEKYVVVKCLHDHLAYDPEFVQMFLDEARLGAQLDHSNCVQTLGLGEQDGRYYLVMEYVAGMSVALMARRAAERVQGSRIPPTLVLGIAAQAAAGLHYAHERTSGGHSLNLVHRDISPQNLVITFEGVVKIVDFGIAKAEERATATRAGTIKGKFAYMSPEQCVAKHVDRRTDVFALGVVTHELLTGRRLFKRNSTYETYQAILECKVPPPSAVNHELDPALDAVIMSALAKDANRRYPTAEAFGEAISQYLHRGHRHAGAGAISTFIEQFFQPEIADHGDRMRELLEGRGGEGAGWDDEEAEEISGEEILDDAGHDGDLDDAHSGGGGFDAGALGFEEVPTGTDQEGSAPESTRIEMNPLERLAELNERVRASAAFPVPEMPTTIAAAAVQSGRAVPTASAAAPTTPEVRPIVSRAAEAVPEPVAPQKERSQPSVQVQFGTPPPSAPPTAPAATTPAAAPAAARNPGPPQPLFAQAKPGGSIFGSAGPSKPGASIFGGAAAPTTPRPATPPPGNAGEPLKIASLFGTDDKPRRSEGGAVPAPASSPPRAARPQPVTEPAPARADQTPAPMRPTALAPAQAGPRGGAFGPSVVPTVIADSEGTPSQRGPAAGPGQATMSLDLNELVADLGNPRPSAAAANATASAMAAMDPSGAMALAQPQALPYGTPPGTPPSTDGLPYFDPQTQMPAHLISLPGEVYPNWDGTYQTPKRGMAPWVLTLILLGAIGVVTVVVILLARSL